MYFAEIIIIFINPDGCGGNHFWKSYQFCGNRLREMYISVPNIYLLAAIIFRESNQYLSESNTHLNVRECEGNCNFGREDLFPGRCGLGYLLRLLILKEYFGGQ